MHRVSGNPYRRQGKACVGVRGDWQALVPAQQIQHEADGCWITDSTVLHPLLQLGRDLCSALHGWPSNRDTCTTQGTANQCTLATTYLRSNLSSMQQAHMQQDMWVGFASSYTPLQQLHSHVSCESSAPFMMTTHKLGSSSSQPGAHACLWTRGCTVSCACDITKIITNITNSSL